MKIFDISIALSDTGFIDILQTRQQEACKLKLMEKRGEKQEFIEKQQEKVKEQEKLMEEYKNKADKPYPVKAYVTFHTIEAANKFKCLYNDPCCLCCCYKKEYDNR